MVMRLRFRLCSLMPKRKSSWVTLALILGLFRGTWRYFNVAAFSHKLARWFCLQPCTCRGKTKLPEIATKPSLFPICCVDLELKSCAHKLWYEYIHTRASYSSWVEESLFTLKLCTACSLNCKVHTKGCTLSWNVIDPCQWRVIHQTFLLWNDFPVHWNLIDWHTHMD